MLPYRIRACVQDGGLALKHAVCSSLIVFAVSSQKILLLQSGRIYKPGNALCTCGQALEWLWWSLDSDGMNAWM